MNQQFEPENVELSDNTLRINEHGQVSGHAIVFGFIEGYDVSASVHSYELGDRYDSEMNHVPIVTVSKANGSVVSEPHAHDSHNATTAIENALETLEYVVNNPEYFVE
jgi:hypothetical protein